MCISSVKMQFIYTRYKTGQKGLPKNHFFSVSKSLLHIRHFLQQTISHMHKRFPKWVHCQVIWILSGSTLNSFLDGRNQISFVLGNLHMILWKISTAISIKHRILATFNINKKFNWKCRMCKNRIVEEPKHWWILHENDTNRRIQQALCKN
jgi:hypothetical protein